MARPPTRPGEISPPAPPEPQAEPTSVERVKAKESFSPDEPLPAFTFPAVDEATKAELLRSVEAARARSPGATPPMPGVPGQSPGARRLALSGRFDVAKLLSELARIGRSVFQRGSAAARNWIGAACTFIDRNRSRLPARLRGPTEKFSAGAILATLAVLALGMLVGVVAIVRTGRTERPAAAPIASASATVQAPEEDPIPRAIEDAKQQGIAALEKLGERYPKDRRVWLELAAENSAKSIHLQAALDVGKALEADPKASDDEVASKVLALAVRKRDASDKAFELLEGPMGSAGAAVLYDLSTDPEVRIPLRTRAEEWIRSDAFKKAATPDVALAAGLRYAKSCS